MDRNQFFILGVFLLLLGISLRVVGGATLNPPATRIIMKATSTEPAIEMRKSVKIPGWVGWAGISVGGISILHSLALKKAGA